MRKNLSTSSLFSSSKLFKKFTDDDDREKTHAPFARGMTTSSKRAKADVGLVSFKDLCTLLDKIKTYRKREGKKTKKAIAKDYLDKFFENHYPQFFKGERRDMFRLYRLFAPQVTTTTTTLFLSFAFLYISLSLSFFACCSRFARAFRGLDKISLSLSLCFPHKNSWTKNARRTI